MKNEERVVEINYTILLKTFLLGTLLAEVFLLAKAVGDVLTKQYIVNHNENWLWIIEALYFTMVLFSIFRIINLEKIKMFFKSKRFDFWIMLMLGVASVYMFDGFKVNYVKNIALSISFTQLTFLVLIPVIVFVSLIIRKIQLYFFERENRESCFLSDKAKEKKNDDKFGFLNQAERFAERVFDNGSSESLVFGIDAPWGTGKSTFVNLCKEFWEEQHKDQIIVYSFDPLRYENRDNLLRKFIDGLIDVIKGRVFAPEIDYLVSKYAKYLKGAKASFSFLGFGLNMPLSNESVDDVFEQLEKALLGIDKKIIIIIDDLDRLDFSAITEVLFVVKKSFTLPNISYIICYDTENIASLNPKNMDKEKISEFLEKFVNVKTSLYLDNNLLLEYFTAYKEQSLSQNILANPGLIAKVTEGLKDIFASNDFHRYLPFVGDARKLKRLINTIFMLEVPKNNLEDYDFDKQDLTHLLLIYINYPNIFRKIYNAESQGRRGFFSLVQKYEDGYPQPDGTVAGNSNPYKNSIYYTEYLKVLTANQRFILGKVFEKLDAQKPNDEMLSSYACFNGNSYGGNRNLEEYLNLIIKMAKPVKIDQYQFYFRLKKDILKGEPIEQVFGKDEFLKNEKTHKQLWRALINTNSKEFKPQISKVLINYALDSLPNYSLINISDEIVGFREDFPFYIVKLLDKVGWEDEFGGYTHNTDENVIKIAQWIFGDKKGTNKGILELLGSEERGILGLYDLLSFRLYCCVDRGGDIYNLSTALAKYEDSDAPTTGEVKFILIPEMRMISQKVFEIFENHFIVKGENIFNEIDSLSTNDLAGEYFKVVEATIGSNELMKRELQLKTSLKAFILYQLGSKEISSGIGCGYYDLKSKEDNGGIKVKINEYLFENCFKPQPNEENYKYFVEYLMVNLISTTGVLLFEKYIPKINDFTKVLEKRRLLEYWENNSEAIKGKKFEESNKVIYRDNRVFSYQEYLETIYNLLDQELISNNKAENSNKIEE